MGRIFDNLENTVKRISAKYSKPTMHQSQLEDKSQGWTSFLWTTMLLTGLLAVTIISWLLVWAGKSRRRSIYSQITKQKARWHSILPTDQSKQPLFASATKKQADLKKAANNLSSTHAQTASLLERLRTIDIEMSLRSKKFESGKSNLASEPTLKYKSPTLINQTEGACCSCDFSTSEKTCSCDLSTEQLCAQPSLLAPKRRPYGRCLSLTMSSKPHLGLLPPSSFYKADVSSLPPDVTKRRRYLRSLSDASDNWIQYIHQRAEQGSISFSLSYSCTIEVLQVTINRLIGMRPISIADQSLMRQKEAAYKVYVKLRNRQLTSEDQQSVERRSSLVTQPAFGILNPLFDQTLTFDLKVKDINAHEIVFTIHRILVQEGELGKMVCRKSRSFSLQSTSGRYSSSNLLLPLKHLCIGVVHYRLNSYVLINKADTMKDIWQGIQRPTELDEISSDDAQLTRKSTGDCAEQKIRLKSKPSDTSEYITSNCEDAEKPAMELSIFYSSVDSIITVCLGSAKGLKFRPSDVSAFLRTVLYKGEKIVATFRSQPLPIPDLSNQMGLRTEVSDGISTQMRPRKSLFSQNEIARFQVSLSRILNKDTLGLVIYLCTRGRFGQCRVVGQCSTGGNGFLRSESTQQWQQLVESIRRSDRKEKGKMYSTEPISAWHTLS
ncbi:hypothetical protein CRM22_003138 [Opisthorchis felineus]|uniref:C2 domain-containing protein n=1 Tax=Opisthorchis felineus TaxID=147828 RepID=A0A4S2M2N7_OPIFE|nr:hypothetical protein CRM22_003138 [Opisthorchis felineus]TGZ70540.1 hypothetical protein CRM22_003138 [Opisthorchis felineus]TGZ70541.1 hypothetical protein CRM22_003138 [Opisthorchis felineus]